MKVSRELSRVSQCRFAAQATTAGPVIERNPQTTPNEENLEKDQT